MIVPESVSTPSWGDAITATGGELLTWRVSSALVHCPECPGRTSLAYMVILCSPLDSVPYHSIADAGETPEYSRPSLSLQNSNLTSSPSGSKVMEPSNITVSDDLLPDLVTTMFAVGSSLNSSTSNIQETVGLMESDAKTVTENWLGAPGKERII